MTLGCFFTCPLVKGGSTQPWPYHGNVVEAYCDDFTWYCGAASNIVIHPNPWQSKGFDDYIDPFQAIRSAAQLRFDVIADLQPPLIRIDAFDRAAHDTVMKDPSIPQGTTRKNRPISIGSFVELHIFEEHCHYAVPAVTLGIDFLGTWHDKPWCLHDPLPTSMKASCRFQPHVIDRWCAASGSWLRTPSLMQGRLLDEHLSHTVDPVEFEDDGPVDFGHQDPEVFLEEEDDLSFLLASFSQHEDALITLEMYGLLITHHSIRSATTSGDIAGIKDTIWRSWSDIMPQHGLMNAFLLKPQDLIGAGIIQLLIEIVPPEIRIPPIDVPILRRTIWYSDDSTAIETAYMRDSQTGYELLIDAGHAEWCYSSRNIQCNLHIEGRIAFMSLRHPLRQGAVLSFFIHDDWVAQDSNEQEAPIGTSDETSLIGSRGHIKGFHGELEVNGVSGTPVLPFLDGGVERFTPFPKFAVGSDDGSSECSTHPLDGNCRPTPAMLKPNPNLIENFDAVIPYRHRTTDGHIAFGRTIPPPNWERNAFLRSAAASVVRLTAMTMANSGFW